MFNYTQKFYKPTLWKTCQHKEIENRSGVIKHISDALPVSGILLYNIQLVLHIFK